MTDPHMSLEEIMRRWPSTVRVVMRYRMLCIGCPISPFHTIADACAAHKVDEKTFSDHLHAAIRRDEQTKSVSAFGRSPEAGAAPHGSPRRHG
ncbi:DUF1858 domain-containing protein [Pseudohoeflea coraliihabitans]